MTAASTCLTATHLQTLNLAHSIYMRSFEANYSTEQLTFHAAQSSTDILWSLGHLAWTYDVIFSVALGIPSELPARWGQLFSFGAKPTGSAADYPAVAEIKEAATAGFARVSARIAALTEAELAAPLPAHHPLAKYFPNVDVFLSMGAFHAGYHVGQIGLLRVAQGLPSLLGA